MIVYGYSKCSTVKKALVFLENNGIQFTHIDNVTNRLDEKQLFDIFNMYDGDIKKIFNTSGNKYRELGLKDKLNTLTIDESIKILSSDGMLVKRPLLVNDNKLIIGFKQELYEELI